MTGVMDWALSSEENMETLKSEHKIFDAIQLSDDKVFETAGKRRMANIFGSRAFRIAAGILLILGLSYAWSGLRPSLSGMVVMNEVSVPEGERANITLPDGTSVWLNSGTTLSYASDFGKGRKREVTVNGQAFLDVTPDRRHPFVVHTYLADVQVLGTKFDVNADRERRIFETSLLEGKVAVSDPTRRFSSISLEPDQALILRDNKLRVMRIDSYDVFRWTEGFYCFKDKRLSEILSDFRKYYNKEIVYTPVERLEREKLSGKFRISDGFDYAMQVLQSSYGFSYTWDKDNNKIYITTK